MAKRQTAAEKAAAAQDRIDARNEAREEDAIEDRAEDRAAGLSALDPLTTFDPVQPVLRNQAGKVIDGSAPVPGPAPQSAPLPTYPRATPDGVVIDWGPSGPPQA